MRFALPLVLALLAAGFTANAAEGPDFIGDATKGAFFLNPFYVNLNEVFGIEFKQNTLVLCEDISCVQYTRHELGIISPQSEAAAASFFAANWFRYFENGETDRFINPAKATFTYCQILPGSIRVFGNYLVTSGVTMVDNPTDRYLCLNKLAPTPPSK